MKKISALLLPVLTLLTASCLSEINPSYTGSKPVKIEKVTMRAKDFKCEGFGTKTSVSFDNTGVVFSWTSSDVVGVFPVIDGSTQVKFPVADANIEDGEQTASAHFTGNGWAVMAAEQYSAYYPFEPYMDLDMRCIPVTFTGQRQNGNNKSDHLVAYDYMATAPKAPREDGEIEFAFEHLGTILQIAVSIPKVAVYTTLELSCDDAEFITAGTVDITDGVPHITATETSNTIELALENFETTQPNENVSMNVMIAPVDLSGKTIKVKISGPKANFTTHFTRGESKPFVAGHAYRPVLGTLEGGDVIILEPGSDFNTDIKTLANGEEYILDKKDYLIRHIVFESGTDGDAPALSYIDVSADASPEPIYASWDPSTGTIYVSSKAYKVYGNADISNMFYNLAKLESVDFEDFSIDYTEYASGLFQQCSSIRSIDLSALNLTTLYYMYGMFKYCPALETIVWPNSTFCKSRPIVMSEMFRGCEALTNLSFACFNGCKAESITEMFGECASLTSIDLSNIDLSEIKTTWAAFRGCSSLTTLDVSNINWEGTSSDGYTFANCSSLRTINLGDCFIPNGGRMDGMFQYCTSLENLNYTRFEIQGETYDSFFAFCTSLKSIDVSKLVSNKATRLPEMFYYCTSLESIDLTGWNTANVQTMFRLFSECPSLTRIDLSPLKTFEVESMNAMFEGCANLQEIVFGLNFITEKTTDMTNMFRGCAKMETIDLTGFNTSKVLRFESMFEDCAALTSLPGVNNLDVHYAEQFDKMFAGCKSLRTLDISKWKTTSMTNCSQMFADCVSMESLDISGFTCDRFNGISGLWVTDKYEKDEKLHTVINLGKNLIFNSEEHGLLSGVTRGTTFICSEACFETVKNASEQWWGPGWENFIWVNAEDSSLLYGSSIAASYNDIADAIALGSSKITLIEDITTSSTIEFNGNNDTRLVLNGHSITSSASVAIKNNGSGTLTIDGASGRIDNSSYEGVDGITIWARTGDIVINEGSYVNKSNEEATVYVGTSASATTPVVTINSGEFSNIAEGSYKWKPEWQAIVLNVQNSKPVTSIQVKGGIFLNQNPSMGDDNLGGSFVPDGYNCWYDFNGHYIVDRAE